MKYIKDMKYTPAEIVEMCCSNKSIREFITNLKDEAGKGIENSVDI